MERNIILPRLVGIRKNGSLLDVAASVTVSDMAVVFYLIDKNTKEDWLITRDKPGKWGTTAENMFFSSLMDAEKYDPAIVEVPGSSLKSSRIRNDLAGVFYRCSNKSGRYGAAGMFQNAVLRNFAREHGSFYILPASTDEVMFITEKAAKDHHLGREDLMKMIWQGNKDIVRGRRKGKEVLSNSLYHFSLSDCDIKNVGMYIPDGKES